MMLRRLVVVLLCCSEAVAALVWEEVSGYPGEGRHHPVTFANETHGFLLTGSTYSSTFTSDFYMYDESTDSWTDLSATKGAFPGEPRTLSYGVVLPVDKDPKAYLGFGAAGNSRRLSDWWQFNMETHEWTQLAEFKGPGRRHPAMVPVYNSAKNDWEIHVGLGDGSTGNFKDWWSYSVATDSWEQLPDFPSSRRHHPFYFGLQNKSYAGLGHSDGFDPYIERDWFRFDPKSRTWYREADFASYAVTKDEPPNLLTSPVTTEARVAGTQFSIEFPLFGKKTNSETNNFTGALGFVLSGDGDDHRTMEQGEFHAFYPGSGTSPGWWRQLPPHPGRSRWAPGSFVMRGTARAYFTSGYDRFLRVLFSDVWRIDLSELFTPVEEVSPLAPAPSPSRLRETSQPPGENRQVNPDDIVEFEEVSSGASLFGLVAAFVVLGVSLASQGLIFY